MGWRGLVAGSCSQVRWAVRLTIMPEPEPESEPEPEPEPERAGGALRVGAGTGHAAQAGR